MNEVEVGYYTDKSAVRTRGTTHHDKSVQDPQIHGQYLFEHLRQFCVRSEVLPLCRVLYDRDSTLTVTAVFKKVVGTHFFFALFGLIGARFSPPSLRQPHGIKVSHIVKLNRAVP